MFFQNIDEQSSENYGTPCIYNKPVQSRSIIIKQNVMAQIIFKKVVLITKKKSKSLRVIVSNYR